MKKSFITKVAALSLLSTMPLMASESVTLYAAGSLKAALSDVVKTYEKKENIKVATKFAPSGLLRKEIEGGASATVFASANMAHPQKLTKSGWGSSTVLFARNQLCALTQPEVNTTSENILNTLLDQNIRVGMSTPKADPSGDYAWELFQKADTLKKGSFETLSKKALQLTGGPNSTPAPKGKNQYGWVMSEKKADVFLTYCTNATLAQKEVPELKIVQIPNEINVGADYGMSVNKNASSKSWELAMFILSPKGQKILQKYGFDAPSIPKFSKKK